ncbi:ParB N-terminal domain-containing protein [Pseudomonas sp.]|uniref:ParB/RepB/Spo0J family partition protein n=1 Tax=Pseudomonas sp. TaxID=306 RepID=UPI002582C82F|nr:ParB N-terminal domain-containing protein [Pseudomonas sp.]
MVNAMAKSLSDIGLINPITVIPAKVYDGSIVVDGFRVVTGNHRVAAARALGWPEIEAFVIADDDRLDQELREIDENLCRAELTPAQRAYAIKRRKEIWEMRNSGQSLAEIPKGRGRPAEFASDTAEATGQSKSSINQHVSRAEALGDDLLEVAGTSLDKGVELDALKSMPEPERKELIQKAKAGEKVSARKPEPEPDPDAPAIVLTLIRQMDILAMILTNNGMTADQLAERFISGFDPQDAAVRSRVNAVLPLLDALGRIGAEVEMAGC